MAHEFIIMDNDLKLTTYTEYEDINLGSLLHVIKFLPDLGTLIDSNEVVLETQPTSTTTGATTLTILDSSVNVLQSIFGATTATADLDNLKIINSAGTTLRTLFTVASGTDFAVVNDTFTFSNVEFTDTTITITVDEGSVTGFTKLVPENFGDGLENHIVLETASDTQVDNHYHNPTAAHHVAGDGHTEEEHREISLWPFKLAKLIELEKANASSL